MQEHNDPAIGAARYRPSPRGEIFRGDQIDRSINWRAREKKPTAEIRSHRLAASLSREKSEKRNPDERRGGGRDVDYTERATHINKLVFTDIHSPSWSFAYYHREDRRLLKVQPAR